jgi:hypothetical protein
VSEICLNFRYPYTLLRAIWVLNFKTLIFYCQLYGCLKFGHPCILLRAIRVSEFQTPLYILYILRAIRVSEFQTPLYIVLRAILYVCLNFRHPKILLRVILVSEFQTPLYSIASYMGVWILDTHITISCMIRIIPFPLRMYCSTQLILFV